MDRAPVDAQVLGDAVDRAAPVASSITTSSRTCAVMSAARPAGARLEHLPREPRDLGIGVGIGPLEVAARADDAVEVVAEFDVAAEHALVDRAIGRRVVREADAPRPPVRRRGSVRSIRNATPIASSVDWRTEPDPPTISSSRSTTTSPRFLDRQEQRLVEAAAVARERLDREPQRRLLADQEPERAEVRQPARLGHQQAERLDAAALGGRLEQLPHRVDRNHELGLVEAARRQPEFAQHAAGDRARPARATSA